MAITTLDGMIAAMTGAQQRRTINKSSATATAFTGYSFWLAAGTPAPGTAPGSTTGTVCTGTTPGAIPFTNPTGGAKTYVSRVQGATTAVGILLVYDRLVASDGLSGTVTTDQTVGTPALTRYTSGEGVEIWLEWYAAIGATAASATVSYTNQSGVSGRTGTVAAVASMGPGRMLPVTLQSGDTGVLSVQSVTLSASTGTAGNFGVTLLRRVCEANVSSAFAPVVYGPFDLGLPEVADNACLALAMVPNSTSSGAPYVSVSLIQG